MKSKQVILNEHLNGIEIENSNDAILNAMEEYARQQVNDIFAFTEWASANYIRLHGTWIHKFADQRKKENYISTKDLYKRYNIIFNYEQTKETI